MAGGAAPLVCNTSPSSRHPGPGSSSKRTAIGPSKRSSGRAAFSQPRLGIGKRHLEALPRAVAQLDNQVHDVLGGGQSAARCVGEADVVSAPPSNSATSGRRASSATDERPSLPSKASLWALLHAGQAGGRIAVRELHGVHGARSGLLVDLERQHLAGGSIRRGAAQPDADTERVGRLEHGHGPRRDALRVSPQLDSHRRALLQAQDHVDAVEPDGNRGQRDLDPARASPCNPDPGVEGLARVTRFPERGLRAHDPGGDVAGRIEVREERRRRLRCARGQRPQRQAFDACPRRVRRGAAGPQQGGGGRVQQGRTKVGEQSGAGREPGRVPGRVPGVVQEDSGG